MNKIKLLGIDWDCDTQEEKAKLPTEVVIDFEELPDYVWDDLEEELSNYLSQKYGYCHNSYGWEFINIKNSKGAKNDKRII